MAYKNFFTNILKNIILHLFAGESHQDVKITVTYCTFFLVYLHTMCPVLVIQTRLNSSQLWRHGYYWLGKRAPPPISYPLVFTYSWLRPIRKIYFYSLQRKSLLTGGEEVGRVGEKPNHMTTRKPGSLKVIQYSLSDALM
jgi:hypothetical protein